MSGQQRPIADQADGDGEIWNQRTWDWVLYCDSYKIKAEREIEQAWAVQKLYKNMHIEYGV